MARILVVDRDKRARSFYERELGRQRHQVNAVSSVHEGLQTLRTWKHDLVILDIEIPGPGEVQAIKSMLSLDKEMPLLFTSSLSGDAPIHHSRAGKACGPRPNDAVGMRQTVRDLLRPRRLEAPALYRRRRVAILRAPRLNGCRATGRQARAQASAARARGGSALVPSARIRG
jgi:DNA-binding NtrC family response regulator